MGNLKRSSKKYVKILSPIIMCMIFKWPFTTCDSYNSWIPIHELVFPKDPNVSFVSIVLANHHITQNLHPSPSRRKEIDLFCKGFTIGFLAFPFSPLSIPRRRNKEISFLLFSINTRSTTSNRNPSPQLQHFGLLFSETVVVFGVWILKFSSEVQAAGTAFHLLRRPEFLCEG